MTDAAIIAASYAAEKNYSHNPDDIINASDAVGAWGTAKESTTELVDLSGNTNIATINGAMPTEGFIQGRRFDGDNDYIGDLGIITTASSFTVEFLEKSNDIKPMFIDGNVWGAAFNFFGDSNSIYTRIGNGTSAVNMITSVPTWNDGAYHNIALVVNRSDNTQKLYFDNILKNTGDISSVPGTSVIGTAGFKIGYGAGAATYFKGSIVYISINDHTKLADEIEQRFNTLARLPFWSIDYEDYPDNVTTYTDNLPYSSSIISSGTFKVDDDVLNCVSAGTITYRASYEFDGSEYIKVEIGGMEYAGTGTITQGNTTVSVAQGSNKITIAMGTADTIDNIDIQFREEV